MGDKSPKAKNKSKKQDEARKSKKSQDAAAKQASYQQINEQRIRPPS